MPHRPLVGALIALLALGGPVWADNPPLLPAQARRIPTLPLEMIRLKDGRMVIGTIVSATNRSYTVSLVGRQEELLLADVLSMSLRVTDLEAGVYFIAEATRADRRSHAPRSITLLKRGLRLLRDYVPTDDTEVSLVNEATARGYLLGGKLMTHLQKWDKAADAYRHLIARYPKTDGAKEASLRLSLLTIQIERAKAAATPPPLRNLNWEELFGETLTAPKPTPSPGPSTPTPDPKGNETPTPTVHPPKPEAAALGAVRQAISRYFPLQVGNWWVYEGNGIVEKLSITREERRDDEIRFSIAIEVTIEGKTSTDQGLMILKEDGLFRRDGKIDEPILLFPIEIRSDGTYNYSAMQERTSRLWRYAAEGITVRLPEGVEPKQREFVQCLDVQIKTVITLSPDSKIEYLSNKFFAPNIGVVRVVLRGEKDGIGKSLVDYHLEPAPKPAASGAPSKASPSPSS